MAINSLALTGTLTVSVQGTPGTAPAHFYYGTTETLAVITTTGYLNGLVNANSNSNPIKQFDRWTVNYDTDGTPGTDDFYVNISGGNYSLALYSPTGAVQQVGASVIGHFPVYQNITGDIQDLGYRPSDPALPIMSAVNGATVVGHFALYSDTAGTTSDSNLVLRSGNYSTVIMSTGATVVGNIPKAADVTGSMSDSGIAVGAVTGTLGTACTKAASDNTKASVASVNGATVVNGIPKFSDIVGTVQQGYTPSNTAQTALASVSGATVIGDVPKFGDVGGSIVEGYAPSDNTKATLASVNGATVISNLASFADITGTVQNAGFALRAQKTSAAGGSATITITDATITANSIILFQFSSTTTVGVTTLTAIAAGGTGPNITVVASADPGAWTGQYIVISTAV